MADLTQVAYLGLVGAVDRWDPERELRYREDLMQREIADRIGCSQIHVSRILRAAIGVLAEQAESEV